MTETLPAGTCLTSIYTPDTAEGCSASAEVGEAYKVDAIRVAYLAGPMAFYAVAVITYTDGRGNKIIPLHMAECFTIAPAPTT